MEPRELRILLLNDDVQIPVDPSKQDVINGWREAQEYWLGPDLSAVAPGSPPGKRYAGAPDMVVCDINFADDQLSPLHQIHSKKPTGLLYAIPFLVQARVLQRPCVVVFHTGDPGLFSRYHRDGGEHAIPDVMPLLAAEFIGLITAIDASLAHGRPLADYREAWDWLLRKRLVSDSTSDAKIRAYRDYRRRLVSLCTIGNESGANVMVSPSCYQALVAWCHNVSSEPGEVTPEVWSAAPGVELTFTDGSRDCLNVRSLFSDVKDRTFFRRELFAPPASRPGPSQVGEEDWISDDGVCVGAFIAALGDWDDLYNTAVRAAQNLRSVGIPSPTGTVVSGTLAKPNVNDEIPNTTSNYALARLLTLVFQAVHMHHQARETWRRYYHFEHWNARELAFDTDCNNPTLASTLQEIFEKLRDPEEDDIPDEERMLRPPEDIVATLDKLFKVRRRGKAISIPDWMVFHLSMLNQLGLVKIRYSGDGETQIHGLHTRYKAQFPVGGVPPYPPKLRGAFLPAFKKGLADLLGFNNPENELKRVAGKALYWPIPSRASDGTLTGRRSAKAKRVSEEEMYAYGKRFIDDMMDGKMPEWLRSLGRYYATNELEWVEEEHWPVFIRS